MDDLNFIDFLLSFLQNKFDAYFGNIPWEKHTSLNSSIIGNIFTLGQFDVEYSRSKKVVNRRILLGVICISFVPLIAMLNGIWVLVAFLSGLAGLYQFYNIWHPKAICCVAVFTNGIAWKNQRQIFQLTWSQISHMGLIKDALIVFTKDGKQIGFDKTLFDSEIGKSIDSALQIKEEEQLQPVDVYDKNYSSSIQEAEEQKPIHDIPIKWLGGGALVGGIIGVFIAAIIINDIDSSLAVLMCFLGQFYLLFGAPLGMLVALIIWTLLKKVIHLPHNSRVDRIYNIVFSTVAGLVSLFFCMIFTIATIGLGYDHYVE